MTKFFGYIGIPALIIHEISHILFGILCGSFFVVKESFLYSNYDGSFSGGVVKRNKTSKIFQTVLVSLSPLYIVILTGIIGIFNPVFFWIFIYFLITFKYSLPSKPDFISVKYAKLFAKYEYDSETFIRFISIKGIIEKNDDEDLDELPLP